MLQFINIAVVSPTNESIIFQKIQINHIFSFRGSLVLTGHYGCLQQDFFKLTL